MKQLIDLCMQRRALSGRLPCTTMRHDERLTAIQELDARIIALARQHGLTEADAYRSAIGMHISCL
jgi:hypothetical protein